MAELSRKEKNLEYMKQKYHSMTPEQKEAKKYKDYQYKAYNWLKTTESPEQLLEILALIKTRKAVATNG